MNATNNSTIKQQNSSDLGRAVNGALLRLGVGRFAPSPGHIVP